jgi:hypothetical protein
MIQFKQEICGNLETALPREWLETNGLGGFASSTIVGPEYPSLPRFAGGRH